MRRSPWNHGSQIDDGGGGGVLRHALLSFHDLDYNHNARSDNVGLFEKNVVQRIQDCGLSCESKI